jgi:hypothetical protein
VNRQERGEWLETQVEEAIAELEFQLNQGHTEGFLQVLDFYSRFHKYSLANTLLIMQQKPEARLCAGYRQWEKLGYHVRTGEQAIWVRAPWMRKETDPDTGEITERLIGWLGVPIFDVSQLVEQGIEIPSFTKPLDGDYQTYYVLAIAALGAEGVHCSEDTLPQGIHGMSTGGRVIINQSLSSSEKFLTLLHEAVHEVLHKDETREETSKEQRELEAEAGSYLLAKLYGLENPFSRDYILMYQGTVEGLHDSMTRIHLAVRMVADMLGIIPRQEIAAADQAAA